MLGNVSDPSVIASFTASMNGGVEVAISHDPNFRRLLNPGDFNVDIAVSDLQSGSNTVVLTATSNAAATTTQSVTINYTPGAVGFAAQTIDWTGGTPDVVAQPIDGRWTAGAGGVRTADPGYDRLLGIGDFSWTDYEVTVPVTVTCVVAQPGPTSGDPAVAGANSEPGGFSTAAYVFDLLGAKSTPTSTPAATDTPVPTSTPDVSTGDANCDGTVNAVDAALILQFNAGLIDSLACQDAADVNSDGEVTSVDAALILQFVAGLVGSLAQ